MHRIIISLIGLALTSILLPSTAASITSKSQTEPYLAIHRTTMKGQDLLLAVWDDGTQLRHASYYDNTGPFIVSKSTIEDLTALRNSVEASELRKYDGVAKLPFDASYTTIVIRGPAGLCRVRWTENVYANGEFNTPENKAFLSAWLNVRRATLLLRPSDVKWLQDELGENGAFRGFDPRKPEDTVWLK